MTAQHAAFEAVRRSQAVRNRAWAAIGAVVLALAFGFIGQAAEEDGLFVVAGLAWVVAIVLGVGLLPFWRRVLPDVPSMPRLFRRPGEGERWCATCGSPTLRPKPCAVCGAPPPRRKARAKKAAKA